MRDVHDDGADLPVHDDRADLPVHDARATRGPRG
jgi:hypothetical protein